MSRRGRAAIAHPVTATVGFVNQARVEVEGQVRQARVADGDMAYMEAKTDYYERQSVALFEREIPQVLLLHGNRLNADHFARVSAMLTARGYRFVTLDAALAEPACGSADTT